ncbi:hypothetical protein ACTTAF_05245 [Rhodobacter capsulatus]|uniref:hypothetical protein n=1 Tax=Rhodobacter capsulatus TaxID=1061 RepID=UPI004038F252
MTGTSVDFQVISAVSNNLVNEVMDRAMQQVLEDLGGVPFDAADRAYAEAIRATLSPTDLEAPWRVVAQEPTAAPLCDWIVPLRPGGDKMIGSTDVSDVTWAVPTTEVLVACHAIGTPGHSWQLTAQGKSAAAHKGMTHAASAMALLAERLLTDAELLAAAQAEHARRLARTPYTSPPARRSCPAAGAAPRLSRAPSEPPQAAISRSRSHSRAAAARICASSKAV